MKGVYKRELPPSLQRDGDYRSIRSELAEVLLSRLPLDSQGSRRKPAGKELSEYAGQDQGADLLLESEPDGHRENDFLPLQPENPLRKPPEVHRAEDSAGV